MLSMRLNLCVNICTVQPFYLYIIDFVSFDAFIKYYGTVLRQVLRSSLDRPSDKSSDRSHSPQTAPWQSPMQSQDSFQTVSRQSPDSP